MTRPPRPASTGKMLERGVNNVPARRPRPLGQNPATTLPRGDTRMIPCFSGVQGVDGQHSIGSLPARFPAIADMHTSASVSWRHVTACHVTGYGNAFFRTWNLWGFCDKAAAGSLHPGSFADRPRIGRLDVRLVAVQHQVFATKLAGCISLAYPGVPASWREQAAFTLVSGRTSSAFPIGNGQWLCPCVVAGQWHHFSLSGKERSRTHARALPGLAVQQGGKLAFSGGLAGRIDGREPVKWEPITPGCGRRRPGQAAVAKIGGRSGLVSEAQQKRVSGLRNASGRSKWLPTPSDSSDAILAMIPALLAATASRAADHPARPLPPLESCRGGSVSGEGPASQYATSDFTQPTPVVCGCPVSLWLPRSPAR